MGTILRLDDNDNSYTRSNNKNSGLTLETGENTTRTGNNRPSLNDLHRRLNVNRKRDLGETFGQPKRGLQWA